MTLRDNPLWKAVRLEVEYNLESLELESEITSQEIDDMTDEVVNDNRLWQNFNEDVVEIMERYLGINR